MIPTCEPLITQEDRDAVDAALAAGHVAQGPEIEAFEQAVAARTGIPYAVAVSSGSMALVLALRGFDFSLSVPTLTFAATVEAIIHAGGSPRFMDHDEPAHISLNFYGHPPSHRALVEDACEGLGSAPIGNATLTCLSFNGNKIITAGGGGMVLTAHADLAASVRRLASHQRTDPVEWVHSGVGYSVALSAFQAALGLSQLSRLDQHVARKRETAMHYASGLPAGASLLTEPPGTFSNYWMPVILLDRPARPVIDTLLREGIGARALWTPLHRQEPYRRFPATKTPVADELHLRGLILPCSVGITPGERETVLAALRGALDRGTARSAPAS